MEDIRRPFDLRRTWNIGAEIELIGGNHQIRHFLSPEKGPKYVSLLNPSPASVKPLLEKMKEPSMLILRGCDQLLLLRAAADFPFERFKTITALEISGITHLNTLPEKAISKMTQLQTLNLSRLPIKQLPAHHLFSNLRNLRSLVLRGCTELHSVPSFSFLENLEVLDVSHCTALQDKGYEYWSHNLRMLDLSYTTSHSTINVPERLTRLFLRDTKRSVFDSLLHEHADLRRLEVLDLSGAQDVTGIDKLAKINHLVALDLSRTKIEDAGFISDLIHLRHLLLRECTRLGEVPAPMKSLTNLEVLDISGCERLGDLPDDLSELRNLKELNLSGCSGITELKEGVFDQMSCLEKLDLSKTQVFHLPSFANLINLQTLNLSHTSVGNLPADLSNLLRHLILRECTMLGKLPTMKNLSKLEVLDISSCQNLCLLPNDLCNLKRLKELNLSGCSGLTKLRKGVFDKMSSLEKLDLSKTNFKHLPSFDNLINLRTLKLSQTLVGKVPDLSKLVNIDVEALDLAPSESGEIDFIGVHSNGMENLQEKVAAGWDGNVHPTDLTGKISEPDEFHLVSTFISHSGFDRFKYEFQKLHDLISSIHKNFKPATPDKSIAPTTKTSSTITTNIKSEAFMRNFGSMDADLNYILENISLLESSHNCRSGEQLLHELMNAATHLSADEDFPLDDSTNLNELLRMVAKLKLLIPPKQVGALEEEEEEEKKTPRLRRSSHEEDAADTDINPLQIQNLRSSYDFLTGIQRNCLLYLAAFPGDDVIKERMLIHLWYGEGFIDPTTHSNPIPKIGTASIETGVAGQPVSTTNTVEEIGQQILEVLDKKRFIRRLSDLNEGEKSGRFKMRPGVHSFVTARAKAECFFNLDQENGKLTPHFTGSQRACLLKSQHKSPSSCKLWMKYANSPGKLECFKTTRTLLNINETIIDVRAGWFSEMRNLSVLHLGSLRFKKKEHIDVVDLQFLEELKNMKQLRLLKLEGLSLTIKLPDSVCKLTNLKMLNLRYCSNLEELPDGIGSLNNLTHLDLTHCHLLYKLPKGIRLLSKLEVLKGFVITYQVGGRQPKKACTLTDLLKLERLRKLNLVVNTDQFPDSRDLRVFKGMKNLHNLRITWQNNYGKDQQDTTGQEALRRQSRWQQLKCWEQQTRQNETEEEEPLTSNSFDNLKKLVLCCFPSETAPKWLDPSQLQNLEKLYIVGGHLKTLPEETNQNTWNVKTLRLKYLPYLDIDGVVLSRIFPHMTFLKKKFCNRLGHLPCDRWNVWTLEPRPLYRDQTE